MAIYRNNKELQQFTFDGNTVKQIFQGTNELYRLRKTAARFIVATGGTVTTDGDYKIHTFTSDGSFEVTQLGDDPNDTVELLVVAGGGG